MNTPIELHSAGEVFATTISVELISDGDLIRLIATSERGDRLYEVVKIVMPRATLRQLCTEIWRALQGASDAPEGPRTLPRLQ
ncbi:hypothetical protein [Acuticoccus sediminis]|uniref:hypothetical protein n=1 Tax=Acuticoccus sediminis TaxID=2184697 RepID=UPI001CFCF2AB|nr:hypothetical protein [Acuticoccus sediminis]